MSATNINFFSGPFGHGFPSLLRRISVRGSLFSSARHRNTITRPRKRTQLGGGRQREPPGKLSFFVHLQERFERALVALRTWRGHEESSFIPDVVVHRCAPSPPPAAVQTFPFSKASFSSLLSARDKDSIYALSPCQEEEEDGCVVCGPFSCVPRQARRGNFLLANPGLLCHQQIERERGWSIFLPFRSHRCPPPPLNIPLWPPFLLLPRLH